MIATLKQITTETNLNINIFGLPSLIKFSLNYSNALAYKTLITQEMLKEGYLAGNSIYVCTEHTNEIIDSYAESLNKVFKVIRDCEDGLEINTVLKTPICHNGFKRLN